MHRLTHSLQPDGVVLVYFDSGGLLAGDRAPPARADLLAGALAGAGTRANWRPDVPNWLRTGMATRCSELAELCRPRTRSRAER